MAEESIRIVSSDVELREGLLKTFNEKGFEKVMAGSRPSRAMPSTLGIWCFDHLPATLKSSLKKHLNCEFPVLVAGCALNGPFHAKAFERGAYVCFSTKDKLSFEECIGEIVKRSWDLLAMAKIMGEWPPGAARPSWLDAFDLFGDLGISIIDRNFRIWYRNKAHREITEAPGECPICWVAYHGLRERLDPCPRCPSAAMFEKECPSLPARMVVGFEPSDLRPARPTEVTAAPLRDGEGRIVGAIEIVANTMKELRGHDIEDVEQWLSEILDRVFLTSFSRARLYYLTPSGEYLVGLARAGKKPPRGPMGSIRLCVREEPGILPDKPEVRTLSDPGAQEVKYYEELDKKNAPYWADLPLREKGGNIIGKVVVDRWSRGKAVNKEIRKSEVEGHDKGLGLIAEVMKTARALDARKAMVGAADTAQMLIRESRPLATIDDHYRVFLKAVGQIPGVLSALIREPTGKGDKILRARIGYGAYYEHCIEDLNAQDSEVSGLLYRYDKDEIVLLTTPSTLKLRERDLEKVEPKSHREELKRIQFQGSFKIRISQRQNIAILCVQAITAGCFDAGAITLLSRVFELIMDSFYIRKFSEELSECFLALLSLYDIETAIHSERVGIISRIIAEDEKLGVLLPNRAFLAGCVHDIGKVGIAKDILRGYSPLTPGDRWYVSAHVQLAAQVLGGLHYLKDICAAAVEHHVWYDGSNGVSDLEEPLLTGSGKPRLSLLGRIVAVADAFEGMTSSRGYTTKERLEPYDALAEIESKAGAQFCPDVVDAFKRQFLKMMEVLRGKESSLRSQRDWI